MIKKLIATVVAPVVLAFAASSAQAADIQVNGGFETGDFSGWTLFPGSGGPGEQQIVSPGNGSSFAARLTETAPAANIMKQANLLPGAWVEGQQVDVQFDVRGTAVAGAVLFVELFSEIDGGGVSKSEILGGGPIFPNGNPDTWTTINLSGLTGSDTSGGVTVQFAVVCGADANCNSDYYFDNVIISADVAPVPVPAAVWLFGSALLGLGGLARKQRAV